MEIRSITITSKTVWMTAAGISFFVLPLLILGYDVIAAVVAGMIAGKWFTFSAFNFATDNIEQTTSVYEWWESKS